MTTENDLLSEEPANSGDDLAEYATPTPPVAPVRRARLTPTDRIRRRKMMLQLLLAGATRDEINAALGREYGLSHRSVDTLQRDTLRALAAEDDGRAPYKRQLAARRILTHIRRAADDKLRDAGGQVIGMREPNFGHVFAGEKLLAEVDGLIGGLTDRPSGSTGDVQVALERVLVRLPPQRVAELAERERARLTEGARETIDISPKPLSSDPLEGIRIVTSDSLAGK